MMRKLRAKITHSFVSSDFAGPCSDQEWRDRVARINPGLSQVPRLTIRSVDENTRQSAIKTELIEAGFKAGDEVVIMLADGNCRTCGVGREHGCKHHEKIGWRPDPTSVPLTFDELQVDDCFISFPDDGDDSGHGGYRGTKYLLRKTRHIGETYDPLKDNYVCITNGSEGSLPPTFQVIKVGM